MASTMHDAVLGCVPRNEPRSPPEARNVRAVERECRVFLRQLRRHLPQPPVDARLTVRSIQLSSGSVTREVVVRHGDSAQARAFAELAMRCAPALWDDEARAELDWFATRDRYMARVRKGRIRDDDVPAMYRPVLPPSSTTFIHPIARFTPSSTEVQEGEATGAIHESC
jgi:hypothetical protein